MVKKKLILTESIIDAASLLQIFKDSPPLKEGFGVVACYGVNGLNEEILNAIKDWSNSPSLRGQGELEIIFAFDNDNAGQEAITKYTKLFLEELQNVKLSTLELPNKDINETLQLHENEIFIELLENRKEVNFYEYPFSFIIL